MLRLRDPGEKRGQGVPTRVAKAPSRSSGQRTRLRSRQSSMRVVSWRRTRTSPRPRRPTFSQPSAACADSVASAAPPPAALAAPWWALEEIFPRPRPSRQWSLSQQRRRMRKRRIKRTMRPEHLWEAASRVRRRWRRTRQRCTARVPRRWSRMMKRSRRRLRRKRRRRRRRTRRRKTRKQSTACRRMVPLRRRWRAAGKPRPAPRTARRRTQRVAPWTRRSPQRTPRIAQRAPRRPCPRRRATTATTSPGPPRPRRTTAAPPELGTWSREVSRPPSRQRRRHRPHGRPGVPA
mmetsp:Transcript_38289/g.121931  ORF Transcript_38289/g.121931 Transcript_38289/m.121931 type:complete len:292 (+) Transcript_38289:1085-1960(+)